MAKSKTIADKKVPVIFVTGMSGGGLSTALAAFEDLGFEVVDNLPLAFVDAVLAENFKTARPIAIGIDTRTRDFKTEKLADLSQDLKENPQADHHLLFMDCSDVTLQERFSETRRKHPLAQDRPLLDGIEKERALLKPVLSIASHVIDSSEMSVHDCRRLIRHHFGKLSVNGNLRITVKSFGFKYGQPRDSDITMDVRFLKNPHYDTNLRPQTGKDKVIADYIEKDPALEPFYSRFKDLLLNIIPNYREEGKSYLTIAIGCTGGKHRSVYLTERLASDLQKQGMEDIYIRHRDINRKKY
jgi:RNase adapter protein RapZ